MASNYIHPVIVSCVSSSAGCGIPACGQGKALQLLWELDAAVRVQMDADGRGVLAFVVPHKGRREEATPAVSKFCELLAETPQDARGGLVCPVGVGTVEVASHGISSQGKAARVVVDSSTGRTTSAHGIRRSFGARWSRRVMPAVLQKLVRHTEITATLKFFV